MSRLTTIKRLVLATLAYGTVVFACRTTEAPPLAPRPEPVDPSANPVPGAPDPLGDPGMPGPNFPTEDGGVVPSPNPTPTTPPVTSLAPVFKSQPAPAQTADAGTDTPAPTDASNDAAVLPPTVDASAPPADAARIVP